MLLLVLYATSILLAAVAGKSSQADLLALVEQQQSVINRLEQKVGVLVEDVHFYKARVDELQLIVESKEGDGPVPEPYSQSPRADCDLGSQFEFAEYVGHFSPGPPMPMFADEPYECLLECIQDKQCVGVNMAPIGDEVDCLKYYNMSDPTPLEGWNHYSVVPTEACFVAEPAIYFQAGLCQSTCYAANTTIPWNVVRANTSQAMGPDGMFTCPLSAYYTFTLNILPFSTNQVDLAVYVGGYPAGKLNIDNSVVSASNTFSFFCGAGQQVWVQTTGVYASNCIYGSCISWESNFVGQLSTLRASQNYGA